MKFTPNNIFLLSFLMVEFSGMANPNPPPPPAGPLPPGYPIDGSLYLMVMFGVVFSFVFLKKYSSLNKKG